jgi:hypothetical protein
LPGSSLEVIKPEFLFQLLMSLFANPSRFGGPLTAAVFLSDQLGPLFL